ncbi:MAG: hypothetical protein V1789_01570 [PVC group bacterium]
MRTRTVILIKYVVILNDHGVEYLLVGAYAVIYYTTPRYTKDVDVWVRPTPENAHNVWLALEEFGAPLVDVTEKDFTDREMVCQIGIEKADPARGKGGTER